MGKNTKIACILACLLCFIIPGAFCQELQTRTIPGALLRPERGETPRYPRDLVIGDLGQGEASEAAYQFARDLCSALTAGADDAPVYDGSDSSLIEDLIETIRSIEGRIYRLGSGREEADGSISFLLRFMGNTESITGELFIKQGKSEETELSEVKTEKWVLDSLILEEKRALSELRDSYRYDFSPYERFF